MGVAGLWSILQPCARPTDISTLNRKRLAVDASIWIYQFLKAVRDKEGNALRNSHVVGFFRRICKLLFFGIKPVFVFDGGAPVLKRQTVSGRKKRREGRREDAVRTAGRLLAVQMQRRAEEDERRRKEDLDASRKAPDEEEEEILPEDLVYVDEIQMTAQERQQNRQFKKKDAYHLPNLDVSLAEMGAPNDPRIMSHEELEEYAKQFHTGEDVNVYDFSKIDFNGPFFQSLPASDRYNILNAARLRSRLRMGYSKEQLDTMFPDRMAFSRFQVERVRERNELTQRLMNINGMNGEDVFGFDGGGRVAGEKGKEYVLVKNDGVEGGWALGVVSNKGEGERSKPIDVERYDKPPLLEEEENSEEEGFEDVPIEGLNRLPKRATATFSQEYNDDYDPEAMAKRRRTLYEKRLEATRPTQTDTLAGKPDATQAESESLFLPEEITEQDLEADVEDVFFEDVPIAAEDDDEELNRAIAMSLEAADDSQEAKIQSSNLEDSYTGPKIDEPLEFNQKNAQVGRSFAHLTNARANRAALKPPQDDMRNKDDFDLQAALEESKESKRKPQTGPRVRGFKGADEPTSTARASQNLICKEPNVSKPSISSQAGDFSGPLPFESLNLGTSFLSKRKKAGQEEEAGGFEKGSEELQTPKPKPPQPLPPWFVGEIRKDKFAEGAHREEGEELADSEPSLVARIHEDRGPLVRHETGEVIDLEAPPKSSGEIIEVDSSGDEKEDDMIVGESRPVDDEVRMGDIADKARAEPPKSSMPDSDIRRTESSDHETVRSRLASPEKLDDGMPSEAESAKGSDIEEPIEWEESDHEAFRANDTVASGRKKPVQGALAAESSRSQSPEDFEDVDIEATTSRTSAPPFTEETLERPSLQEEESIEVLPAGNEEIYSDPEDEDLMRQLATEAEEHARFASTLNTKSQAQNAEEYEKELKQLRNQQKKDRRDADEVTHVMVTECQQLLKLFGLPYITAPMEAEAQCAELVSLGLVDGIVTDDSDIFLFGGTRVYKNMFNQAKFVECYLTSDLEKEYSLDRQRLIGVAHLLGSDYTEGIPSVGPVTALEILSEFGTLEAFSEWCNNVQLAQKLSVEDSANAFRRKFRKQAQKIFLPSPFPDKRVDIAYLNPEVDSDPSAFEWGVPDLDSLRSFLMATIGWTQERTDEVLVPVIRDMNRRDVEGTQANITQFFGGGSGAGARQNIKGGNSSAFAPRRRVEGKSKRMENALGRLHEQARKRTIGENEEPQAVGTTNGSPSINGTVDEEQDMQPTRAATSRAKKRAAPRNTSDSGSEDSENGDEYQVPPKTMKSGKAKAAKGRGPKRSKAG
ncbi:MAG: hypothetical protein Q9182_006152 [Xanthomendoza sp. 2 TL-2023]